MAQRKTPPTPITNTPPSVDPATGIELLKKLIGKANDLKAQADLQESDINAWRTIARDYLIRAFGTASPNVNAVLQASGDGGVYMGMDDHAFRIYFRSTMTNKIKILESCIEQLSTDIELQALQAPQPTTTSSPQFSGQPHKVFVVHGHNHGVKESVARFLEKLELEAVVLHERPNAGRTVIEKFSDYADVHFAVVLLTADDEGRAKNDIGEPKLRARQNVVLELGYFLGRLGRSRVCALYEQGVEIPSDYQGVLFLPLDAADRWKFDLVRELMAVGFVIDANRIFSPD